MKRLLTAAAFALLTTAAHADSLFMAQAADGHANMRNGPGSNHALIGAIPNNQRVRASRCVPRDDRIAGADWCLVEYGGIYGWVSQAVLMPVMPAPIPEGTIIEGYPLENLGYDKSFICDPPQDFKDRNPPTTLLIDLHIDGNNHVTKMEVAYDLQNGERVYRSRQYHAILTPDPTVFAGWKGTYLRDTRKTMAGGLYARGNNWFYREKQWDNGRPTDDYTAICRGIDLP